MMKWTKEACIEDAKKYNTKIEWRRASPSAHANASFNGWVKDCHAHMPSRKKENVRKWTRESLLEDAKRFSKKNDWRLHSYNAYSAAKRYKLLSECCGHMS